MDTMTKRQRSRLMSRIRSKDTTPEMATRSILRKMGYRYRLHRRDLPGTPDIAIGRLKAIIDVRGCFWHRHKGCRLASEPSTNVKFWTDKFARNVSRDRRNTRQWAKLGWKAVVLWECELNDPKSVAKKLKRFLDGREKLHLTFSKKYA